MLDGGPGSDGPARPFASALARSRRGDIARQRPTRPGPLHVGQRTDTDAAHAYNLTNRQPIRLANQKALMIDTLEKIPRWATAVRPVVTSELARDLKALGNNFEECRACQARGFALRCAADALGRFLAPRFFTTVLAAVVLCAAFAALT